MTTWLMSDSKAPPGGSNFNRLGAWRARSGRRADMISREVFSPKASQPETVKANQPPSQDKQSRNGIYPVGSMLGIIFLPLARNADSILNEKPKTFGAPKSKFARF
ncbi:hypothetical protein PGT21_029198 [Puccinia graminis f. sp. tritici]|uniref:Uncharacterized protein n=1 Tax=Puccinia graminis f. sp. tritici TaxID=56615 RepID=A0A5B0P2R1_PUCGR|nr:hypothetical protein PGT21_029198 [Puccinia graminis f. sp. tritici]